MRKPPTSKFGAPRQREKFQQANARLINPTAVPLNAGWRRSGSDVLFAAPTVSEARQPVHRADLAVDPPVGVPTYRSVRFAPQGCSELCPVRILDRDHGVACEGLTLARPKQRKPTQDPSGRTDSAGVPSRCALRLRHLMGLGLGEERSPVVGSDLLGEVRVRNHRYLTGPPPPAPRPGEAVVGALRTWRTCRWRT